MSAPVLFGTTLNGLVFSEFDMPSLAARFRLAADAGCFDFLEYSPRQGEVEEVQRWSETVGLPIRAGSHAYTMARDEKLAEWHIDLCGRFGSSLHNMQIRARDADGCLVSDDEVARLFVSFSEKASKHGVAIAFEIHINMWSEEFDRVARVAALTARMGWPLNVTLDHSHCLFKWKNEREKQIDERAGRTDIDYKRLDPENPDSYYREWLDEGWVRHVHARSVSPSNLPNMFARHPNGSWGRGVQYPFVRPQPGEWHSDWSEEQLGAWKSLTTAILRHTASQAGGFEQVTAEFIPGIDYGAGAKYSLAENNVSCVHWLRETLALIRTGPGENPKLLVGGSS
jgi:hypothetical protein